MKTKTMMSVVFSTIVASAVITAVLSFNLKSKVDLFNDAASIRYQSYQVADELRQSSDDLTRFARTYAVTGDEKYEKMYMDILAIRNGEKPRPEKYNQIYWDLVLNYGDKPKPDGAKVVLKTKMQALGFSDEEFRCLDEAQQNSNALVAIELKAMNAVKGIFLDPNTQTYTVKGDPNLVMARELLHSEQYHKEKVKIMTPIDNFFSALDKRTEGEVVHRLGNLHAALNWVQFVLLLVIFAAVIGFVIVKSRIVTPLVQTCRELLDIQQSKNLARRITVATQGEIGEIVNQINLFIASLASSLSTTDSIAKEVADLAKQTKASIQISRESSERVARELDASASAMEEMTTTLVHVSESTSNAENRAAENETHVTVGQQTVSEALKAMSVLEGAFTNTQDSMLHLVNESTQVSNVLSVIKAIAEQTNLLALNAAIEAARAGEQGRGFAVVADEVRSLAQRTQDSTKEIDDIVASLQNRTHQVGTSVTQAATLMQKAGGELQRIVVVFEDIRSSTEAIHGLNTQVAASTEEQSLVSKEIASSMIVIRDNSREVSQIIEQIESTSINLDNQSQMLRTKAGEYQF
ncbi:methyl-accepting chemotaxis protein [Shewanella morhuae]|uniref:methyl-accepting chemotaxis protein n=1 Tax=Shewanella morhuae TaxID=365591 RepID=UPI001BBB892F|nr:methyl-accepting chemotaxis protein [Shewanella morhuae]GIU08199.1 methyl-accepting chemotaxis protein [Shewanella morhuae]